MRDDQYEQLTPAEADQWVGYEHQRRQSRERPDLDRFDIVQVIKGERVYRMQVWEKKGNQIILRSLPAALSSSTEGKAP